MVTDRWTFSQSGVTDVDTIWNMMNEHLLSSDRKQQQTTKPVVILGGGGDGRVVLEIIRRMIRAGSDLYPAGFLDDGQKTGVNIDGVPVLGCLEEWKEMPDNSLFIPALHRLKDMPARMVRIRSLGIPESRWFNAVDPSAALAQDTKLGTGCCIGQHVVVQPGCRLGSFVSIRAGASIGHDCKVEDFCYLGPNSTLCGGAVMKTAAHLAPGAVLSNGMTLGSFAVLGAASAGLRDIPDGAIAQGNPARIVDHQPVNGVNA